MDPAPIVTVTLNPALDFAADVPELIADEKLRCNHPSMFPGGGGVNVARAIRNLDGHAKACVALGGPNGQTLETLLRAEGVDVEPVRIDVQTRHSLTVRDLSSGKLYRFMLPGTPWTQLIEAQFLAEVTRLVAGARFCVLSGSMPPGTGVGTVKRLATICHLAKCKLVVDTSGPTLQALAADGVSGLDILRMDREEAQTLAHAELETPQDFAATARVIIERGVADTVVIGIGSTGNLLVSRDGTAIFCPAPKVEAISRVGAGDSFVGAMVLALSEGGSFSEALVRGAAAASVAVTKPGTELCDKAGTDAVAATIKVSAI